MQQTSELLSILRDDYPTRITVPTLCEIAHISRTTALYLVQSKVIPNRRKGSKAHKHYYIETRDVIFYILDRTVNPERYRPPSGWYSKNADRKVLLQSVSRRDTGIDYANYVILSDEQQALFADFINRQMEELDDVISSLDLASYLDYSPTTIRNWCDKGWLDHYIIHGKIKIPKEYAVSFLSSQTACGIRNKSSVHRKLVYVFCDELSRMSPDAPDLLNPFAPLAEEELNTYE